MRDRLIELLKQAEKQQSLNAVCGDIDSLIDSPKGAEFIADYLFENGVIVPPCKMGDIIWVKDYERNCEIQKAEIIAILKNRYGMYIRYEYPAFRGRVYARNVEYIGKDVFLTKEDAERTLKGGAEQ